MKRCRGDNQIVGANQLSLRRQLGVKLSVRSRYVGREIQRADTIDDYFDKRGSAVAPRFGIRAVDAHQQFR